MVANANQARREFVAFHGDPARKAFYLERLRNHVRKDDVIQGAAEWNGGNWGVIGCTVHSSDRSRYEADLGIPTEVASLEEIIFERLPEEEAKRFSLEFLEAVPVGTDLSFVWPAIARWLLIDPKCGIIRFAQTPETRAAILLVADLYARVLRHEPVSPQRFRDAVQIAGPLGEGVAAQVVSGAAEAVFDTTPDNRVDGRAGLPDWARANVARDQSQAARPPAQRPSASLPCPVAPAAPGRGKLDRTCTAFAISPRCGSCLTRGDETRFECGGRSRREPRKGQTVSSQDPVPRWPARGKVAEA